MLSCVASAADNYILTCRNTEVYAILVQDHEELESELKKALRQSQSPDELEAALTAYPVRDKSVPRDLCAELSYEDECLLRNFIVHVWQTRQVTNASDADKVASALADWLNDKV